MQSIKLRKQMLDTLISRYGNELERIVTALIANERERKMVLELEG